MHLPVYQVQVRFGKEPQRTVLFPASRDVSFLSMTRLIDDLVRNGWEQSDVTEAWLYEDNDLVAYVHEKAFERDMEVLADGHGDAVHVVRREKRPFRRPQRKVS